MANILKQIKVGDTTYNIEPVTAYLPLSGGTITGSIQTKKLIVSSETTAKATMQYNSTEDCIEFIFA